MEKKTERATKSFQIAREKFWNARSEQDQNEKKKKGGGGEVTRED